MSRKDKIEKITIKGFKSIKELVDFELRDINILIGANGSGKSNFIQFFEMIRNIVASGPDKWFYQRGGAERIFYRGIRETREIKCSLAWSVVSYEVLVESDDEGRVRISTNGRLGPVREEPDPIQTPSGNVWLWGFYHFHDVGCRSKPRMEHATHDDKYLRPDASNIAPYLLKLQNESPDSYARIRDVVRLAMPTFDDFVLKPRELPTQERLVNLRFVEKGSDYEQWPSQFSDGTLRFICLATVLLQPDPPSTIIIDEPELGLHPFALALLASLIRKASAYTQVIVSTQSSTLVSHFEPEDLVVVERSQEGFSTFKRPNADALDAWLEEYTLGEVWEKNLIGGRP